MYPITLELTVDNTVNTVIKVSSHCTLRQFSGYRIKQFAYPHDLESGLCISLVGDQACRRLRGRCPTTTVLATELCEAHDAKEIRSPVNKEER